MVASISCGYPLAVDGGTWNAQLLREFDLGSTVTGVGSATAVAGQEGVIPAPWNALGVIAGPSGLTASINAGFCAIQDASGNGIYKFGLMQLGTVTIAANASGNPRIDLVVAQVHDIGTSSSFADINIITGTPASSPVAPTVPASATALATIAVANGATAPGTITDMRTFVVNPGGILPVANAASAPPLDPSCMAYSKAAASYGQGKRAGGGLTQIPVQAQSAVQYVWFPGGKCGFNGGWKTLAAAFVLCDGITDFEITYKWRAGQPIDGTESRIQCGLWLDGTLVDFTYIGPNANLCRGAQGLYCTSSVVGTTLSPGQHTITLQASSNQFFYYSSNPGFLGDNSSRAVSLFVYPIVL